MQEDNPSGVILSTDDYFYINGQYQFDVKYLGEAHEWNQNRGKKIDMRIQIILRVEKNSLSICIFERHPICKKLFNL